MWRNMWKDVVVVGDDQSNCILLILKKASAQNKGVNVNTCVCVMIKSDHVDRKWKCMHEVRMQCVDQCDQIDHKVC